MQPGWVWRSPPNWPPAPPGWTPPVGWRPPPEWPPPPPGWAFWVPAGTHPYVAPAKRSVAPVERFEFPRPAPQLTRSSLVTETWFVMLAFLWPAVTAAVVTFAEGVAGKQPVRFATLVAGNEPFNLVFGILAYLPVAAVVPLALYVLSRTGQTPRWLGMGAPRFMADVLPGVGLAAAAFGCELGLAIVLAPLLRAIKHLKLTVPTGHVPTYFIVYGIAISIFTAVTEEVLVNGYLITRLGQLGWSPNAALLLSLALRTSYHVYYGVGFIFTVPFGYFVTRSFQKHRRLNRAVAAHFLYDATLTVFSLTSGAAHVAFVLPFCGLAALSLCFSGKPAPELIA
jgi:membrane protease YdiL (CAAX protease family)